MKAAIPTMTVLALLLSAGASESIAESYSLETKVYVFKSGEFQTLNIPGARTGGGERSFVFESPVEARIGAQTLSLEGKQFSWSGAPTPPDSLTTVGTPIVTLAPGQPVSLLSTVGMQYFEKGDGDKLLLKEIDRESPDAPHRRLTFVLKGDTAVTGRVQVGCEVDVTVVRARERLQGVALEIGKPVPERFSENVDLNVTPGQWSGFVVEAPSGSDYSVLALLKLEPRSAAGVQAKAGRLMTAEEFAQFATYYYQHPQPELIARAIESLGPSEFLERSGRRYSVAYVERAFNLVGFFAAVFAANPDRLELWRTKVDGMKKYKETQSWLRQALALAETRPSSAEPPTGFGLFRYWGAFFASGNPSHLRNLVDHLVLVDDEDYGTYIVGATIMETFAYNAPHHSLIRATLEEARKQASPRTRELINDLLTKDLAEVQRDMSRKAPAYHAALIGPDYMTQNPQGITVPPAPPNRSYSTSSESK